MRLLEIITVNSGDTVFSIATRYGVSAAKLIDDNGLDENAALVTGQSIVILFPDETYTARPGDSVATAAMRFGVSTRTLFRNNIFLEGRNYLEVGSNLVISYEQTPTLRAFLGGYAYDFISQELLDTVVPYMTYLMPFTYGFRSDGSLVTPDDDRLVATAVRAGARPLMHLSTLTDYGNFSNTLSHEMLMNNTVRQTLIENVKSTVIQKNYYGVDIDFEFLFAEDRQRYVEFITLVSAEMNGLGKICVVAVPPKTSDTQTGLLYEGVDYAGLGEAADYVFVMTYEWGYRFGPPLAIAPIQSAERVVQYSISRIPPEKIILGISNYGYDWTLPFVRGESDAPSLSTAQALELAGIYGAEILFDELAQAPYFYYTDPSGRAHVVWFEDARSYAAKVGLIRNYGLAGGFIWDLMRENPQGYVTLNALMDIE